LYQYCVKYIYLIYIILEIFSCDFLKRHCVYFDDETRLIPDKVVPAFYETFKFSDKTLRSPNIHSYVIRSKQNQIPLK